MKKIVLFLLSLVPLCASAQNVELSSYYGDNMVLQRSEATTVLGKTTPNTHVSVTIAKPINKQAVATAQVKSDDAGNFKVKLKLDSYGTGYVLTIGEKEFKNVAIGEVWLLSGQSNMAWQLFQSNEAHTVKDDSDVRLLLYNPTFEIIRVGMTPEQLDEMNRLTPYAQTVGWQEAKGEAARQFSAIGMFFAAHLREKMPNVPVGLIQTAMGGAPIEAFLPHHIIDKDTALMKVLDGDWRENGNINEWCRGIGKANLKGVEDISNQRHYFMPSYLYEARMEPLKGTTIKGVLWYQGESNADNIPLHKRAFRMLLYSWRTLFENGQLPFYFVQLSGHNRENWPAFRNSQRTLAEQNEFCEMVVSHDYGNANDVHPRDKKPIGIRLANIALYRDYGFSDLQPYSPLPANKLDKYNGLKIYNGNGLRTNDGEAVRGFEVSDDGVTYTEAIVLLLNNKIRVISGSRPLFLRYGWKPTTDANVVNAEGLPLSTFTMFVKPLKEKGEHE